MISEEELPSWQRNILRQLDGRLAKYFVVEDPDCMLAEQSLNKALSERGFVLYIYEDSIELRYFLSTQLTETDGSCVISVDSNTHDTNALPYDLLSQAQRLSISLVDCFQGVAYTVLQCLQPEELGAVDAALVDYTPGQMSESASADFVLRHVFKLVPEVIQTPSDLLQSLLRLHYRDVELPSVLKSRLIALLARRTQFVQWPLDEIVSSKQSFTAFLQRHWPAYVTEVGKRVDEPEPVYRVLGKTDAKVILPFGHDDVRIYIDTLFLEGYLAPIEVDTPDCLAEHWSLIGVQQDPDKEFKKRIKGLLKLCDNSLPLTDDRHQQWLQYAYRWAELAANYHLHSNRLKVLPGVVDAFAILQKKVDERFSGWMLEKYAALHNHPPVPPVMLHHVPRLMARDLEHDKLAKTALIVIDGLAMEQWITAKASLNLDYEFEESAVFAWVPTVTSVSRQALFSAKAPYQFPKTISTTSGEPKAWQQFWMDNNLDASQIYYKKGLGRDDLKVLIETLSDRRLRAVGLVINTVDDMMHGMQLGSNGMHNQVRLWAESGYLERLVAALLEAGFTIHLTSDHGNVEAAGSGKLKEGAIADSRGERARVYKTEGLMESIDFSALDVAVWPRTGLPGNYWPVVMKGRQAFVAKDERIVGHGGIALEEVIVPYIRIR